MAKVAMVTPRFTANKVGPNLCFILKFRYMKHSIHDQITESMFMNSQILYQNCKEIND